MHAALACNNLKCSTKGGAGRGHDYDKNHGLSLSVEAQPDPEFTCGRRASGVSEMPRDSIAITYTHLVQI